MGSPKFCMEVCMDSMDSPNKLQKYKKSTKVLITQPFLSYRLQILHGSSYGLSNHMTKYKSTKSTKVQKYKSTKYKTKKYKNTKTKKMHKIQKNAKIVKIVKSTKVQKVQKYKNKKHLSASY